MGMKLPPGIERKVLELVAGDPFPPPPHDLPEKDFTRLVIAYARSRGYLNTGLIRGISDVCCASNKRAERVLPTPAGPDHQHPRVNEGTSMAALHLIACERCGGIVKPTGRNGQYRKTQRFCSPKCARAAQVIKYRSMEERFNKWVEVQDSGCWKWTGNLTTGGYGRIRGRGAKGKLVHAHVFAYTQKYGSVPDGKELDHLCRNRWCCNPDHLEAVTHRENVLRGDSPSAVAVRRGTCQNGHPFSAENTYRYVSRDGKIRATICRVCKRERRRAEREARRGHEATA